MTTDELRARLRAKMEEGRYSLRDVDQQTGVAASTIGRFLRSEGVTYRKTLQALSGWVAGLSSSETDLAQLIGEAVLVALAANGIVIDRADLSSISDQRRHRRAGGQAPPKAKAKSNTLG